MPTPEQFLRHVIDPNLKMLHMIGGPIPTDTDRRFLLCVALQESGADLSARYQAAPAPEPGPARGWWQFEEGGGVVGVMNHAATQSLCDVVCEHLVVVKDSSAIWRSLEGSSALACMFARMLMLTDPYPVPATMSEGWECYADRLWRPGAPHPETWEGNWTTADQTVRDNPLT